MVNKLGIHQVKKVRLLSNRKGNQFYILVLCIYQLKQCYVDFDIVRTSKTMQYLKRVNFDVVLVSLYQTKTARLNSIRQNLILKQSFGVICQRVDCDWLTAKQTNSHTSSAFIKEQSIISEDLRQILLFRKVDFDQPFGKCLSFRQDRFRLSYVCYNCSRLKTNKRISLITINLSTSRLKYRKSAPSSWLTSMIQ